MRAHQFRHQWIEPPNQFASRFVVIPERSFNQCACIKIIHVVEIASTLLGKTSLDTLWLQVVVGPTNKKCNPRESCPVITFERERKSASEKQQNNKQEQI